MAEETPQEKATRERKERQKAVSDALKRSKGGPTEVPVATEGTEDTIDQGGSGDTRGNVIRRRTLTGFGSSTQAKALNKPIAEKEEPKPAPSPAAAKPKLPADMSDTELDAAVKAGNLSAASERNRRKTAGKK